MSGKSSYFFFRSFNLPRKSVLQYHKMFFESSGKIEAKIKLNRLSQTYSEGELIAGVLVIEAGHEFRHEGIVVALQGDISMDQM